MTPPTSLYDLHHSFYTVLRPDCACDLTARNRLDVTEYDVAYVFDLDVDQNRGAAGIVVLLHEPALEIDAR